MQYIAFDSHKRYTYAVVEDPGGNRIMEQRIEHRKGELAAFLTHYEPHSPVALETIGSWYWIVDEIEAADMEPKLVNARRAKMMLCSSKKTDRLDARGMNTLQRAGTLPTVWIPPAELRDIRELVSYPHGLQTTGHPIEKPHPLLLQQIWYLVRRDNQRCLQCQRTRGGTERMFHAARPYERIRNAAVGAARWDKPRDCRARGTHARGKFSNA